MFGITRLISVTDSNAFSIIDIILFRSCISFRSKDVPDGSCFANIFCSFSFYRNICLSQIDNCDDMVFLTESRISKTKCPNNLKSFLQPSPRCCIDVSMVFLNDLCLLTCFAVDINRVRESIVFLLSSSLTFQNMTFEAKNGNKDIF